jgi:hypothetical protein
MLCKNKCFIAGLGAAAVAVLSVGGYLLHRKVLKCRLRELARRQAMNLAMFDLNGDDSDYDYEDYGDYDDDGDDSDGGDYINSLMEDLNEGEYGE